MKNYRSIYKLSFLVAGIKLGKFYKSVTLSNKKNYTQKLTGHTGTLSGVAASRSKFESPFIHFFSFTC